MNREGVMELVKQPIQVSDIEKRLTHQFHLGEDMNVPDAKDDVMRIFQSYGRVCIKEMEPMEQYLKVKGSVKYQILYATADEDCRTGCLEGEMPFEEMIYVEGEEENSFYIKCNQLEFQTSVIHSRKISLKAFIELEVEKTKKKRIELTTDVETDQDELTMKKKKVISVLELVSRKSDTYRIKEEVKLPGTKENIGSLLLYRIGNVKLDTRTENDEIHLRGEAQFFCMYISDEWKEDYVTQTITFEGKVESLGLEEGQYHNMRYQVDDVSVDTQMDEDGELRILNIEATLKMDIQVLEEKEREILEDIYRLDCKCDLQREDIYTECLLLLNQSKCKISENLALPELKDDLLQICTADGMVQLEKVEVEENGLVVEGILHMDFLYIKEDDKCPYASFTGMVPFVHQVECKVVEHMIYDLDCYLEQIAITMAGNGEIEVKALVNIRCFMKAPQVISGIKEVVKMDFNAEELESQAGIIGYIYKEEDSMWDLGKRFHTTSERILNNNKLSEKDIKAGRKLLIFKENMSIL